MKRSLKIFFLLVAVAIVTMAVSFFTGDEPETAQVEETVKEVWVATPKELSATQSLYVLTGDVQSTEQAELKAETSGQITAIHSQEGQYIQPGKTIVEIDHERLDAQVKAAQGVLITSKAHLDRLRNGAEDLAITRLQLDAARQQLLKLQRGARQEEVRVTEIQIENTQQSLEDAKKILSQTTQKANQDVLTTKNNTIFTLQSAATSAQRVMSFYLQEIVVEGNTPTDCRYNFLSSHSTDYGIQCLEAYAAADNLHNMANGLHDFTSEREINGMLLEAKQELIIIQNYLEPTFLVVDKAVGDINNQTLSESTRATYKNNVLTAQSELESALNQIANQMQAAETQRLNNTIAITNAQNRVNELENSLTSLEQELTIQTTGARREDIAIQQSQVEQLQLQLEMSERNRYENIRAQEGSVVQARAQLTSASIEREKAITRAPFPGKVLNIPVEVGDYVTMGETLALFANDSSLEIITYVSEKERELITTGMPVTIESPHGYTEALIAEIAPSLDPFTKKIKVTILPTERTKKITIGSTIRVKFNASTDAVSIPLTAVKFSGENAYALTVTQGTTANQEIILGNTMGGMVEILEGLDTNDQVVMDARGIEAGEEVTTSKK